MSTVFWMAVFCNFVLECLPHTFSKCFWNYLDNLPAAHLRAGITFTLVVHFLCASFSMTYLSGDNEISIRENDPSSFLNYHHPHCSQHYLKKKKKTPWSESLSELYRPSYRRLSKKWLPTFADRGCHVVSVTDPCGRILGFLDRSRYFSIK
jgi:hypothetical protein